MMTKETFIDNIDQHLVDLSDSDKKSLMKELDEVITEAIAEHEAKTLPDLLRMQRELCAKAYYDNFKLNIVAIHDLIINAPSPLDEIKPEEKE